MNKKQMMKLLFAFLAMNRAQSAQDPHSENVRAAKTKQ
jgi:hypothetical protein